MKMKVSTILAFTFTLIIISSTNVYGMKASWDIWADGFSFNSDVFTVSRDNMIIKMRVEVYEGGPVSVFILNETSYNTFSTPGNANQLVAYAGTKNISLGTPVTIEGSLGPRESNTTGEIINYYVVVDNRANSLGTNVQVVLISTVPASSALFVLFTLIPIAYVVHRKRKK